MKYLLHILLIFVTMLASARINAVDFSHLKERVERVKTEIDMQSGTSIAIIQGDKIIYKEFLGYSNIQDKKKVSEKTKFYIASTTKAIFSLATLIAEQKGDLEESTNLSELFPKQNFSLFDPKKVTVNHLLTHRSGIDHEAFTWAGSWTGSHDKKLRDKFIATLYPNANNNLGEFEYTNLGYNVMSVWFEDFYQKDWRDTVSDFILKPLQMNNTSGYMSDIKKNNWEFAEPYSYKYKRGKEPVYLKKDDKTMYAIGMISNVSDVSKLVIAELNNGRYGGRQIFPKEVILKSQKRQAEKYAWGWQTAIYEGFDERYHTGGFVGTSALISFIPEAKIGVVVLQNESGLRANVVGGIIKDLVYQELLGKSEQERETKVIKDISWIKDFYPKALEKIEKEYAEHVQRDTKSYSSLTNYTGSYNHPLAGEITIDKDKDDNPLVIWRNLRGKLYGGVKINTAVANFRPGKYYEVSFEVDNNEVLGLKVNGHVFKRN